MRISELVESDNGTQSWVVTDDGTIGDEEHSPYPEACAFTPVDREFSGHPDQYSETGRRRISLHRFNISNIDIRPADSFWTRRPSGYNCVSGSMDNVRAVPSTEIFGVSATCHSGMPGFCYLLAFRQEHRHDAAYALGKSPPLSWLLNLPYYWFVSRSELMRLVVSGNSNQLHVTHGVGTQLVMLMVALTKVYDPEHGNHMSMWYELRRYGLTRSHYVDQCLSTLSRGVTVGGLGSLTEFLSHELMQLGFDRSVVNESAFRGGIHVILEKAGSKDESLCDAFKVFRGCGELVVSHHVARVCALKRLKSRTRERVTQDAISDFYLHSAFKRVMDVDWFTFSRYDVNECASTILAVLGLVDVGFGITTSDRLLVKWAVVSEVFGGLLA